MKKSERLKTKRKINYKCFLLANVLTLFFVLAPASPAGRSNASAAGNLFDFNQKNAYSEPFSKLIEFLNEKKNELEKYNGDFLGAKAFFSSVELARQGGGEEGENNNFADEFNPGISSFLASVLGSVKDSMKNVVDSAKSFVFSGDNQNNFDYISPTNEENAKEIENLKSQYTEAIDETSALSQKFSLLQNEMEKIKNSGVIIREPFIEQRVVERTIEKIVSGLSRGDLDSGLSSLKTELQNLNTNLTNQINTLSAQTNKQTAATYQTISLTNKIDSLSGTRLSNITVSGVSGLADSDIPDGITVSNYLPLTGGNLTGNLGFGTTSPYRTLSVAGNAVVTDNLTSSYFTATSTTATSTFPLLKATTALQVGSDYITDITGTNLSITNGVLSASGDGVGASPDWVKETNYGTLALTASTTIPYWAKSAIYASSTSVFQGLASFGNASTSQISATNSYLGTVLSGAWNGTAISNQYGGTGLDSSALTGIAQIVSGTWSASSTLSAAFGGTGWGNLQANTVLLGNGAGRLATTSAGTDGYTLALVSGVPTWTATSTLSTITGTLAVGKGGTGQTSFGQGWLNSDGTTFSASTSPTVNYITATSTTATSTFPYLSVITNSNLGTVVGGTWQGVAVGAQYGGTGQNFSASSGLVNFYSGTASTIATSSLGLLTTNVAEGTNQYWTDNRFDIRLTATTTLPRLTTLLGLTNATTTGLTAANAWFTGNVGIGTTSPYAKLSVVGETVSSYFTATTSTASTFPYASTTAITVSGTASTTNLVVSTGSILGTISSGLWSGTTIGNTKGGTGIDSSALTGIAQIVAGIWSASSTLSTAFGGTGWNSLAAGSVLFGNGAAAIATSSSFYWDNSNSRLGIGTTTPDSKLTVFASADDSAIEFSSASGSTYKWTMGLDYSDAGKFKIASSTALGSIDRFTIDGRGYVGIGTTTPATRLDVADSGNNNAQMRLSRETDIHTDFNVAQTTGDLSLNLYGTNANDVSLYAQEAISTGANLWVCEGTNCPSLTLTDGGNIVVERDIKYPTSGRMKRSIILTAAGAIVPATSGAAKTQVDGTNSSYYVLDFDKTSDEAAFWQWTIPDSYDSGTIDITYYWTVASATTTTAVWCFQAKGVNTNESVDSSLSSAICETGTAQNTISGLASTTESAVASNFTVGEYVTFKVFRDADHASDLINEDARLVKVKLEYGVATESD